MSEMSGFTAYASLLPGAQPPVWVYENEQPRSSAYYVAQADKQLANLVMNAESKGMRVTGDEVLAAMSVSGVEVGVEEEKQSQVEVAHPVTTNFFRRGIHNAPSKD
jgi:hypothetical protein